MPMRPDLSSRPFQLTVERTMTAPPHVLFQAWTELFDLWFAAPGTVKSNRCKPKSQESGSGKPGFRCNETSGKSA